MIGVRSLWCFGFSSLQPTYALRRGRLVPTSGCRGVAAEPQGSGPISPMTQSFVGRFKNDKSRRAKSPSGLRVIRPERDTRLPSEGKRQAPQPPLAIGQALSSSITSSMLAQLPRPSVHTRLRSDAGSHS